jgi:nitroreductase/NAD-dependent dihydropyrimidine dehydrogenase PreA subunit
MGLITIDESKCKQDGFCVRECPSAIIQLQDSDHYPEISRSNEANCIICGHCVAVCPHGALSHKVIPIKQSPAISKKLKINEDQAVQFLRSRRSIRLYRDKPVEKEKIRRLIEIARYAPTGGNSQAIEWWVVTDKSRIKNIAGLVMDWLRRVIQDPKVIAVNPYLPRIVAGWDAGRDSVLRNAPVLITASAPKEAMNGLVDLTIALTYLELMALPMGLGTCWAGLLQGALLNVPAIKTAVGIPADHPHHYPMMLGYPDVKYFRLPERKSPKITVV